MPRKSGFETTSRICNACSTLSRIVLMTCLRSGGCLPQSWSTRTSWKTGLGTVISGSGGGLTMIGYTVEPPDVPIKMPPRLVVQDLVTPMLLGNNMESKLQEGSSHICWGKRHDRSRRSGNGLNIFVLPHNLLLQVTHHPLFASHDPSRVPTHVMKRSHVSSVLVRPPGDMTMLHGIQQASEVFNISKPRFRCPSTHIRVRSFVI